MDDVVLSLEPNGTHSTSNGTYELEITSLPYL
jgi:hypothetical protein